MQLYDFQKEAVDNLTGEKHICIATTGAGKTSIALHWAHRQGKDKILICTPSSKRDSGDWEKEADMWFPEWRTSLSSFEVISWQGLPKWLGANEDNLGEYAIVFDELQCAKAGISSQRGHAFLDICRDTDCWTGYTATPGDRWIDFYAYFTACNKAKNKTWFIREFCVTNAFRGYENIVDYKNTDTLKQWWSEIALTVDTSEVMSQLPTERHKVITFPRPTKYRKFLTDRISPYTEEFIDTCMGFCATLRRLCATDDLRMRWLSDFIDSLDTNAVIFYSFNTEGDTAQKVIENALPKGAKVWRIDGRNHDIPNQDTVGDRDIILVQWEAGSAGLNFQFAHYWVALSPNYSYTTSLQARGRIKRIGQQHHMDFIYLKAEDTIECDIYNCLHEKSDFADDVWSGKYGITTIDN